MKLAKVGLLVAYSAFALTFRGPRDRFWHQMTTTGAVLGALAIASDRTLQRPRMRWLDAALGLGLAGGLYGIFQIGDRIARQILPRGEEDIRDIYRLRELRPKREIAVRLTAVIGPAEELFWRGLVQRSIGQRLGRVPGAVATTVAYGGAHLVTGNVALIGAATVAGAYWSALSALGVPMAALIVSHVVWDIWIFLVSPTGLTAPTKNTRDTTSWVR